MSRDVEIDRALTTVAATINEQQVAAFDRGRVQRIVADSIGEGVAFTVDDGGGLHDETGARIGAIRRTGSGEWIIERQNQRVERAGAAVPTQPPWNGLRKLLTMLHVRG